MEVNTSTYEKQGRVEFQYSPLYNYQTFTNLTIYYGDNVLRFHKVIGDFERSTPKKKQI